MNRLRHLSLWLLATLPPLAMAAAPVPAGMARIPGGETRVGSEQGRADESPSFIARVASFDIDRTPVTVAAFAEFVRKSGYVSDAERLGGGAVMTFGTGRWTLLPGAIWRQPLGPKGPAAEPKHPVTQVSYNDALAYCAAHGQRLPTEPEWEHAARSGSAPDATFAFGDQLVDAQGRYRANVWTGVFPMLNTADDGYRSTSPVAAFGYGPQGLADMAGNVWQWTSDWYRPYSERERPWPKDRVDGEKAQRGGSFLCDPKFCYGFRVTARGHATPESSHMHVGFRCARSLDEAPATPLVSPISH